MKIQLKKTLIIISSAVVLFASVFFITQRLNNLVNSTNTNKEDIVKVEEKASEKIDETKNDMKTTKKNYDNEIETKNPTDSKTTNSNSVEKYSNYTVKKGDTLCSIARNYMPWKSQAESTKILETMNSLKNREILTVGSHLMIPVNTLDKKDCTKYIVSKGDSVSTIAEKHLANMNLQDAIKLIMDKNRLSNPTELSTGLEIYIPNSKTEK